MATELLDALKRAGEESGGEKGIQEILNEFYSRMAKDPLVGFFFHGKDLTPIVEQQKHFLMRAMGLSSNYSGKSPGSAHQKLPPILKGHFDRRLVLLKETLKQFHLTPASINAWVNFEETFRKAIVEEEGPRR